MTAIFFDVDGTLVRWPDEYRPILAGAIEREAGTVADEWLDYYDERFFDHFGELAADPYRRAFADVRDRFDLGADPADLAATLVEREFAAVEPNPGIADALPKLAERHTLGVLTNGVPEVQFGKLDHLDLLEHFDVRVASHDPAVAATKPDAAIYEAAWERAERAGEESGPFVMVGDSREADVEGARRQGFEAVHVDASADDTTVPDFETLAALL
jgi:putative hydrolase of the HAD superfamily